MCVLHHDVIVLTYVDDCILLSPKKEIIDDFILFLKNGSEKIAFKDEGTMERYLGVEIQKLGMDLDLLCLSHF